MVIYWHRATCNARKNDTWLGKHSINLVTIPCTLAKYVICKTLVKHMRGLEETC